MIALVNFTYLIAMLGFVIGLKFLSSPSRAKNGNLIAAGGMALAVLATLVGLFYGVEISVVKISLIFIAIIAGYLVGKRMSDKVEMTEMPQLISFFNAMGGGCAMLLGIIESRLDDAPSTSNLSLMWAGLIIGAASFSGSRGAKPPSSPTATV